MRWALLVVLLVPAIALARGTRAVSVEYTAPEGCPDQGSFVARLRARAPSVEVAPAAGTLVKARIAPRDRGFEGELRLVEGGAVTHRRVRGDSCAEVADAVALIAALAVDPTATATPAAPPSSGASSATLPSAAPSSPSPPAAASAAEPSASPAASASVTPSASAAPPPPPHPEAIAPPASSAPPPPPPSRARPWPRWSLGLGAAVTGGVTPDLLLSVPVFFDVAWAQPSLRLRLEYGADGAGAEFTWAVASVDACPVAWTSGPVRLSPCLRLRGGALAATGEGVTPSRAATRPWLDGGGLLRSRLALPGPFFLEIEGGGFVPVVRDRFFVQPDVTVHRASLVLGAAAVGAGVSFP